MGHEGRGEEEDRGHCGKHGTGRSEPFVPLPRRPRGHPREVPVLHPGRGEEEETCKCDRRVQEALSRQGSKAPTRSRGKASPQSRPCPGLCQPVQHPVNGPAGKAAAKTALKS